jgi:uncharacterized membrane protein YeaQ/YmgE (transglycosylase-associated protein family)
MPDLISIVFSPLACIGWIVVGGLAGMLASQIAGERSSRSFTLNVIVGLIGAVIGGFVLDNLFNIRVTGSVLNPIACIGHIVVATVGAVILIMLVRLFTRREI